LDPQNAGIYLNLANSLMQKGDAGKAIGQLQAALHLAPSDPRVLNNLAWILTTCSDVALRNGPKAIELARRADTATDGRNPIILHTLAAAYAETGQFPEAVDTDRRALQLAQAQSNAGLAQALQSEIEQYRAGKPMRAP
jgi:Flp pilus assembly protein TadD